MFRPKTRALLERILRPELEKGLHLSLSDAEVVSSTHYPTSPVVGRMTIDPKRLPKLTQWTLRRKKWIDQILEVNMRAEERSWLDYRKYYKEVIAKIVERIFWENVFEPCFEKFKKQIAKDKVEEDARLLKRQQKKARIAGAADNDTQRPVAPRMQLPPLRRPRNLSSISDTTGL